MHGTTLRTTGARGCLLLCFAVHAACWASSPGMGTADGVRPDATDSTADIVEAEVADDSATGVHDTSVDDESSDDVATDEATPPASCAPWEPMRAAILNSTVGYGEWYADLAVGHDGTFFAAWMGGPGGIWGRARCWSGAARRRRRGCPTRCGQAHAPTVAAAADGGFAAAWQRASRADQARWVDRSGRPIGESDRQHAGCGCAAGSGGVDGRDGGDRGDRGSGGTGPTVVRWIPLRRGCRLVLWTRRDRRKLLVLADARVSRPRIGWDCAGGPGDSVLLAFGSDGVVIERRHRLSYSVLFASWDRAALASSPAIDRAAAVWLDGPRQRSFFSR